MNATLTVLYQEEIVGYESDERPYGRPARVSDRVEVTVHQWASGTGNDVVIESRSMVDGTTKHHEYQALPGTYTDAYYIRMGIDMFDALHRTHPNLHNVDRQIRR